MDFGPIQYNFGPGPRAVFLLVIFIIQYKID